MKINLLPIVSSLHVGTVINQQTQNLLREIEQQGDFAFFETAVEAFYDADLALILVQSGGSEGRFLQLKDRLHAPYYLLTYGANNSLAASIEILSYLKANNETAEILHGSAAYIADRLKTLCRRRPEAIVNLGVIGKPSDWLIASGVDPQACLNRFNIRLVDIPMTELTDLYAKTVADEFCPDVTLDYDAEAIAKSGRVAAALDKLISRYHLEGLSIRCFDLLGSIHTTGCLALSLMNRNGIVGTCEGDIPAMISMFLLRRITGQCGFQANPARIDIENKLIVLAHCTLPLDMAEKYRLTTHYESGIGVAVKGEMKMTDVTLFKLSGDLQHYYVAEGRILENLNEANLCRTQIKIQLDDVRYFLTNPYGNHHIVVYGHCRKAIDDYLETYL
ncbi:MAG: hypothetical protein V1761_03885 [bacterium]